MKTFILYAILFALSSILGFYANPLAFLITIVLGLNLLQAAFTGIDPIVYLTGTKKEKTHVIVPPPA